MNTMKKIAVIILAIVLTAALSLTAFAGTYEVTETAASGTGSFSVTINQKPADTATHNYKAYQLFAGDLLVVKTYDDNDTAGDTTDDSLTKTEKILSNITWGNAVDTTKLGTLATALNGLRNTTTPEFTALTADSTSREFAEAIAALNLENDAAGAQALAEAFAAVLNTTSSGTGTYSSAGVYTISGLNAGYYLIKDDSNPTGYFGANTRYILQVIDNVEVTEKASVPSIDKLVQDEVANMDTASDDTNGWGETADHAINESFKFKLVATIPTDVVLTDYTVYKVEFYDVMSAGVTFEAIDSVSINSHVLTAADYTLEGISAGDAGKSFTLTIADILTHLSAAEKAEAVTVTVVYSAHLNENAVLSTAGATNVTVNNNKVKLDYSNNPNAGFETSKGETPFDSVFVFTYKVENTKFHDADTSGNEMAGAGFTLYTDSNKTTAVKLINNGDGTYTVADQSATTGVVTEMTSFTGTGKFDIYGLDAGTYYLAETTTPSGYNTCADITITITAAHTENNSTEGADLTLTATNTANRIVNKKGTELPATGSVGTTLFIAFGSIAVILAGIFLITNKRIRKEME